MTDLQALLAPIRARRIAACDYAGPVTIKESQRDVEGLLAAIEAVARTHKPSRREHTKYNGNDVLISYTVTNDGPCTTCYPDTTPTHCEDCDDESCTGHSLAWRRQPWPCPTITALAAALGSDTTNQETS